VVSVDAKPKAWSGDCNNAGHAWHPQGQPVKGRRTDFVDTHLGQGMPYGVSDIPAHNGWGSGGIDQDTAQVAAESLRRWGQQRGARVYPTAQAWLVTAEAGGRNGYRLRVGKVALQALADAMG
jgi:DDE family transposase